MSRRRKILTCVALALGVAIVLAYIHHLWLRQSTKAYIAQLKAEGEPMDLGQVIPPPVPPDQNGAPLITNALAHLKSGLATKGGLFTLQMVAPGRAIVSWQQPVLHGSGTNKWAWQALGTELVNVQSNLDSFQSLMDHPALDFNLDYRQAWSMPLPQLRQLHRAAQWLSARTFYELHQGNLSGACANLRMMLAIIKGETDERTTVSQLVRVALASMSAGDTWEILQYPNIPARTLAGMQQDWNSLKFVAPSARALLWERVAAVMTFNRTRKADLRKILLPARGKWMETRWDWFWSYEDELRGLRAFQVVIDAARMTEADHSFQPVLSFVRTNFVRLGLEKVDGETQLTNFDLSLKQEARVMFTGDAYASVAALRKEVTMKTWRSTIITAIALKRYELRYHHLPATLEELVPEFLKSVLTDYMNGQPLHYRRNADGTFLLYSVGLNGIDDGGDPTMEKGARSSKDYWLNSKALDWVWPQPATPEEIQQYYDRHSKDSAD